MSLQRKDSIAKFRRGARNGGSLKAARTRLTLAFALTATIALLAQQQPDAAPQPKGPDALPTNAATTSAKEVRRVLIFYELGLSSPGVSLLDKGIRDALDNSPYQIELYREYLETTLFPDPATQQEFQRWYIHKYRERRPDLIVAVGPSPLRFMVDSYEAFFKGVPIVFVDVAEDIAGHPRLDSQFTGVWEGSGAAETVEVAMRLLPGTQHLVVVAGNAPVDQYGLALVRQDLHIYESKLDVAYLTNFTMPQLLEKLEHLPSRTVVLRINIAQDATGTKFVGATQSDPMVVNAANAPVFTLSDVDLGHGEVGGDVISFAREGQIAGDIALKVLQGERPQDIPIVKGANVYMFDWRALKRWRLKESNLPPGSIVLNRQPSAWEAYKWYIVGGVSVIFLEALLILALLYQRKKRRRAEAVLQESEERFRLVANSAPVLIWMSGPDQLCTYFNQQWLAFTGRSLEAELGNGWAQGVHPDDMEKCLKTYIQAFNQRQPFTMEYRLRRHDGEYRWVMDSGAPMIDDAGSFSGYIGSAIDVTERKLAEQALAGIGGKLISAQEQERTRIARELHDDISQQLAFVAVSLSEFRQAAPTSIAEMRNRIDALKRQTLEIANGVQALSHRLHSSKLEYLGLVVAMQGFCREFSEQHHVEVRFSHEGIPDSVPREISLCLFRVMQAALTNALKHSGVKSFDVRLQGTADSVHLTVHDSGVGFDPEKVLSNEGIGLVSMRERVRLVNGKISIQSKPNQGATIEVDVPLAVPTMISQSA